MRIGSDIARNFQRSASIKHGAVVALTFIIAALILVGVVRLEFWRWRLEHPQTPTWVFFLPK